MYRSAYPELCSDCLTRLSYCTIYIFSIVVSLGIIAPCLWNSSLITVYFFYFSVFSGVNSRLVPKPPDTTMAQFLYRLRVCYFIMATLPQDFRFFPEPDPIIELLLKPLYFGYKCLYPLSRDTVTWGQVFNLLPVALQMICRWFEIASKMLRMICCSLEQICPQEICCSLEQICSQGINCFLEQICPQGTCCSLDQICPQGICCSLE